MTQIFLRLICPHLKINYACREGVLITFNLNTIALFNILIHFCERTSDHSKYMSNIFYLKIAHVSINIKSTSTILAQIINKNNALKFELEKK